MATDPPSFVFTTDIEVGGVQQEQFEQGNSATYDVDVDPDSTSTASLSYSGGGTYTVSTTLSSSSEASTAITMQSMYNVSLELTVEADDTDSQADIVLNNDGERLSTFSVTATAGNTKTETFDIGTLHYADEMATKLNDSDTRIDATLYYDTSVSATVSRSATFSVVDVIKK